MRRRLSCLLAAAMLTAQAEPFTLLSPEELGQLFFFDPTLSRHQDMGCFTCHQPAAAFIDLRQHAGQNMISQGSGGERFGIRNAPSIAYAANSPPFHYDAALGRHVGGQFWDGRAIDLAEQVSGPLFTDFEMGMRDSQHVALRLAKNPQYAEQLKRQHGQQVFVTVGKPGLGYQEARAFRVLAQALAAYEKSAALRTYDSKYDRFLAGKAEFSAEEEAGRALFFDPARSNCAACHAAKAPGSREEPFSTYVFYNIGVPGNPMLIRLAQRESDYVDHGLMDNPRTDGNPALDGQFRTPSLRNVAVTAPYMHNGVFADLRTVLHFHDHYNHPARAQNWGKAEVPHTIDYDALAAPPLSDAEIDALIAFLKTLTDQRYEALLALQP
ncbi:MAG: cytochrome c peroxidase [Cardiobacteriaceae bacterium]|nr:cytochrome c peroxidase [Cardiobacteriaceae bacterium]